ncbi:MAG: Clp1/GlmU family protein [Desulfurococcaceae archaeon]
MPILKMNKDEMLCLTGPMSINILNGRLEILYKEFGKGEHLIIHKFRNYIVHALEDTELDITMGDDAKIQLINENEPYLERLNIVNDILTNNYDKVVILGGVDTGKSTLSILLSNKALRDGLKPAIIDGDIGQADIGPPCFISMSYPSKQVLWMRDLKPCVMKFIGDIKPQNYTDKIIYVLKELIEQAISDNRNPIIIDTDGWINDEYAVNYKCKLVSELNPKAVIAIGEDTWSIFQKYENIGIKVYKTRVPLNRRTRNREERRQLRKDKYLEYLNNAPQRRVSLDKVVFIGHPLFHSCDLINISTNSGFKTDLMRNLVYVTKCFNTLHVVSTSNISEEQLEFLKKTYGCDKVKTYSDSSFRRIFIAVSNGEIDYPGLIEWIDFRNREAVVKTNYTGDIKYIKLSRIHLTEDYVEQVAE